MSFISDFLGGSSKHDQSNTNQSSNSTTTQNASQKANINQQQQGQTQQQVSSLDDSTQQLLQTLIRQSGNTVGPSSDTLLTALSGASPAISSIQSLAANGTGNVDDIVNNAESVARRQIEDTEGVATDQGRQINGSADNSASQFLKNKFAQDSASTVATAGTSARLGAENTQANVSNAAAQALQSLGLTNLYDSSATGNLASVLKGATTTGNTQTSSTMSQLSNLISSLTQTGQVSGNTNTTDNTSYTPSLIDTLGGLLSLGKA